MHGRWLWCRRPACIVQAGETPALRRPAGETPARQRVARRLAVRLLAGLAAALVSSNTWAGMPYPTTETWTLTELGTRRFEAISFFLFVLLLSTVAVRWLWNRFVRDFPRLPRLSFRQSLAVVVLWGLLFLVVLTMIAGTRELMTPGTWQHKGLLYSIPERSVSTAATKPQDGTKP